ncbi:DUF2490 domain-containing protein [Flagellimonas algicola]|uniref:DUF2490 domain-containing protein n=1 Tax=Flagellimonas algicola TaxID=2583815 RepID=A0ABY2WHX5_9FLAO|nr:DUF2490 domain-containing protein [Allomuricauda algicola]TMU54447.1 DUF2490 domain-containing protein [Allomuricauda algicola]
MRFIRLLFLLSCILLQSVLSSQTFDEHGSGSWLEFSGTNKIDEKWSIPLAGILRHHEPFEVYDFSFVRTGVSYHLSNSVILTGGIAYVNSKSYLDSGETSLTFQYWTYEEFTWKNKFNLNSLSHRWRLENRWIHNSGQTHFNNRFRYRLQFQRPIYGKTFVKSNNEVFVNLDGVFFNQNRFYVGIGRELSPDLKIELGYLKNHFQVSHHNAILMGITFTTDFTSQDSAEIEK